jgi:sec-independent protein translocase protein TatC
VNHSTIYFIEFRSRLIHSLWVIGLLFLALFLVDQHLYHYLAKPLLKELPLGYLIATDITSPFTVPLKVAFISALLLGMPYLLYQLWSFIAPALHIKEKRHILPFLIGSILLFYAGIAFAYGVICPITLGFFAHCAPKGVRVMTDIQAYLDFMLRMLLACGLAFQVPVLTVLVVNLGLCSVQQLIYLRPYVIVGAFVLGMLLTPPDVFSQIMLALPIWGLFEVGLWTIAYKSKRE